MIYIFLKNIKNICFDSLSKKCKTILLKNFIDNDFGNVKLYKSKKRLELRLNKKIINDEFTSDTEPVIVIRHLNKNESA